MISSRSKAGFGGGGEVRGGVHLPGDDFAPLLKFSSPPLNFRTKTIIQA